MSGLLIILTAVCVVIVTWVAVAAAWIIKQLIWLRAVLVPWMVSIHKAIQGKQ